MFKVKEPIMTIVGKSFVCFVFYFLSLFLCFVLICFVISIPLSLQGVPSFINLRKEGLGKVYATIPILSDFVNTLRFISKFETLKTSFRYLNFNLASTAYFVLICCSQ